MQRGDILIERLTGKRAIVIEVMGLEGVACRFADGRCEDRFTFELERPASLFGSLLTFAVAHLGPTRSASAMTQ